MQEGTRKRLGKKGTPRSSRYYRAAQEPLRRMVQPHLRTTQLENQAFAEFAMERETLVAIYQSIEPWCNDAGDRIPVDVRKRRLQKHALRSQGLRCELFVTIDSFRATVLAQYCRGLCEDCRTRHAVVFDGVAWVHPATSHECKATALRTIDRELSQQQGGSKDAAANGLDQRAAVPTVPRAAEEGRHGT